MTTGTLIAVIAAAVLLIVITVVFVIAFKTVKKDKDDSIALVRESYERTMNELKASHEKTVAELKAGHEKTVADLKRTHEENLGRQLETVKAQVTAESEKLLKAREEDLERRAKLTFETLAGGLDRNIKDMKEAFEKNRKTHTETSQSLKENLENAVRNLREQTASIGGKADSLADALRGRNKTQGNWGEIILDNLFTNEGMREGRDYDKEETLRAEHGNVVMNEDTTKRMRPD